MISKFVIRLINIHLISSLNDIFQDHFKIYYATGNNENDKTTFDS